MSFVAEYADRCRPSSAQVAASSLRSFLRYLQLLGLCDANLAAAVPRTPRWRLAGLPKTMTDEQLGQFLAHFDRSTAVAAYLRRGRPTTSCRSVFVRHRGPTGGSVGTELIRGVMRRAYAEVDGCARWTGTHVLRRTAATRLHRQGAALKEVADLLGHCCIDTTAVYAKVDLPTLAAVALPWPEVKS